MNRYLVAMAFIVFGGNVQASDLFDEKCREFRPLFLNKFQLKRPEAPSCVQFMTATDSMTGRSCGEEMQLFREKVEKYSICLADEQERNIEEFNKAVNSYNLSVR